MTVSVRWTGVEPPGGRSVTRVYGIDMREFGQNINDLLERVEAIEDSGPGGGGVASGRPFIDVKEDYDAVGDGIADDTIAIQQALDAAAIDKGTVWIPAGLYRITATLVVPTGVSVDGPGAHLAVITSSAAIIMMTVGSYPSGAGDRYGMIKGFALDGQDTATGGLDLIKVVVQRAFMSLEMRNIDGFGYRLDATQNCAFISCDTQFCDTGWKVLNDAGSNLWLRCEVADSLTTGILFGDDNTLGGYALAAFGHQGPCQNKWIKCLIEYGTMIKGMDIVKGRYNEWDGCNFTNYNNPDLELHVHFQVNALANKLIDCTFNGNGKLTSGYSGFQYAVKNEGFRNQLIRPTFEFQNAVTDYLVASTTTLLVEHPQLSNTYRFEYIGVGDSRKGICIIPLPSELVGTTANRPNYGPLTCPFWYYDYTKGRMTLWDGVAWQDPLLGGGGGTGTVVSAEIPTGAINGTNKVYTLAHTFTSGSVAAYLNGIREIFVSETPPNQVTFDDAPHTGDTIWVDYTF